MALKLALRTVPDVPLEAEVICPDRLKDLSAAQVAALPIYYGNQQISLGEMFEVSGRANGELELEGDLGRVKHIGAGMTGGRIRIAGNVGLHLGAGMSGGEIMVQGNAGDWVGPEISGGRIIIQGNAGHLVGSAYRGAMVGMRGGEILIHGKVGNEVGNGMRNGLIAIGSDCGDFAGVNMRAGTIIVLGQLGWRSGAGMRRGSIVSMHTAPMLPTFSYACAYHPPFLGLYLLHLREYGLSISDTQLNGLYQRWIGDAIELNRGEILLFQGGWEQPAF
jgi:formylmethanofuran dehydrogenase subunit C